MTMTDERLVLHIQGHGVFAATLPGVRASSRYSKRALAGEIGDLYGGTAETGQPSYWMRLPKSVLEILHASMTSD
jgi:hypothetical protein